MYSRTHSCVMSMLAPAGLGKGSCTEVQLKSGPSSSTRPWWWGWSPCAACSGAATCCSSCAPTSSCCCAPRGTGRDPGDACSNDYPRRPPCPRRGPTCCASHGQPGANTTCCLHQPQHTNSSCCLNMSDRWPRVCTNSLFGPAGSCP